MDHTEDLKIAFVDMGSSIKQQIIDQSDNYTLQAAKEEPGIEVHVDCKQTCNSVDIIKQELNENDNGCSLLSIKQEELDIKEGNLEQSSLSTECHVRDKTDFNLNTSTSNKIRKRFSCTFCDNTYGAKYSLKLHLAKHTGQKPFSCTLCDYTCVQKRDLEYHLAKHTGEKPFSCTFCDYKSISKYNLKSHLAKHAGGKQFNCTVCDYKSIQKRDLKYHLAKHTGQKPFSCTLCDYTCVKKRDLEYHLAKHTGEKPFSCTFCDYKSITKYNLKSHLAKHTGGKQFNCTFCDYTCIRKRDFEHHVAICNFKSMRKSYLDSHVAKHTGKIPFSCTICKYKTVYKYNMTRHMKSHSAKNPTVKRSILNAASKTLISKINEVPKEDNDSELAKALKVDLDQNHLNLQNSKKVLMIKKEEIDVKDELL